MKLLTYCTASHKTLLRECFLPSIFIKDEFEVELGSGSQHSEVGAYNSPGFNQTTADKIGYILAKLEMMENDERILYSDCDVVFLKPVTKFLSEYENFDMVFQNGFYELNTGFMLIRNCQVVRTLLRDVIDRCDSRTHDQDALNAIIKRYSVRYTKFDSRVSCPAAFIYPQLWDGQKLPVTDAVLVFHACWCVGVERKKLLLDTVMKNRGDK